VCITQVYFGKKVLVCTLEHFLHTGCGQLFSTFNTRMVLSVPVSRLHCESESFKMDLILDVNTWLYPMELGTYITDLIDPILKFSVRNHAFLCLHLVINLVYGIQTNANVHCQETGKIRVYITMISPLVLYECETWSLTLREGLRLRVFENRGC
jgi:hypothetical protein